VIMYLINLNFSTYVPEYFTKKYPVIEEINEGMVRINQLIEYSGLKYVYKYWKRITDKGIIIRDRPSLLIHLYLLIC
ncbi:MAG: hypothetical protein ABWW65_05560, partial [Thermoprotei archaeon]